MALDDTLPEWFDNDLLTSYYKKRDRSGMSRANRTLDAFLRTTLKVTPQWAINTHKHTWEDIEELLDFACADVIDNCYNPDLVIGIKSGGAFIANYVAKRLNVQEVDYMRTVHYSERNKSTALSLNQVNQPAKVSEAITKEIIGKKVLLVDDSAATGSSLIVAKEHAFEKGAKEAKTLCMYSRGNKVVDYFVRNQLAVYFPWGKDA